MSLPSTLPPIEALYNIEHYDRAYALVDNHKVAATARHVDAFEVVDSLEEPTDLARALAAMLLVGDIFPSQPRWQPRINAALLNLIRDTRAYQPSFGVDLGDAVEKFQVGRAAATAYGEMHKSTPPKPRLTAFLHMLDAGLKNSVHAVALTRLIAYELFAHCFPADDADYQRAVQAVGKHLANVVADEDRTGKERIAAYEALTWHMKPLHYNLAKQRADVAVIKAIEEPDKDLKFLSYARQKLYEADPQVISKLQNQGAIRLGELPGIEDLFEEGKIGVQSERLYEAALRATPQQIIDNLAGLKHIKMARKLTALYLAGIVAQRGRWYEIAEAMLEMLLSKERYQVVINDKKVDSINVGEAALQAFNSLVKQNLKVAPKRAVALYFQGLERLFERGLDDKGCASPVWIYISNINIATEDRAQQEVRAFLLNFMRDRERSAMARFIPYFQCPNDEMEAYALQALLDRNEDPGFRVYLGFKIAKRQPKALANFVDMTVSPWRLLPGAPADLPISAPHKEVPLVWLESSVVMATDDYLRETTQKLLNLRLSAS